MTNLETSLEPTKTEQQPAESQESVESKNDSMEEYYQLKQNLLVSTLVISAICFVCVWYFYSLNIALNYLLGASFSIVYLSTLAREVEKIGTSKRRISSTRLLLFVGLIMVATKLEQLKILPIFLGFLTYKPAVFFYILPSSLWKAMK